MQVSDWKSNTGITLISIILKQMPYLEIKLCKGRSLKLKTKKNHQNQKNPSQVSRRVRKSSSLPCLSSLCNSFILSSKTWQTYYPEDYMKTKTTNSHRTTNNHTPIFSTPKKTVISNFYTYLINIAWFGSSSRWIFPPSCVLK